MTRTERARGVPALRAWTRVEVVLAVVLLAIAAGAWALTAALSMPDMQTGILTSASSVPAVPGMAADPGMPATTEMPEMPGMPGASQAPDTVMADMPGLTVAAAALFLFTWVVMMAAMMLPAITPFTVGLSRLLGDLPARRVRLAALTVGYLAVWSLAGVAALGVVQGFSSFEVPGPTAVRIGAVVLLVAGIYQFTPLKRWCLVRCRSPLALIMRHGPAASRSERGALVAGMTHGAYCLGCCWALMLVLLAAGVMSLVWMAALAAVIVVEKVPPRGEILSWVIGAVLLVLGLLLLVAPGLVV